MKEAVLPSLKGGFRRGQNRFFRLQNGVLDYSGGVEFNDRGSEKTRYRTCLQLSQSS